jgi:hypothetical protein
MGKEPRRDEEPQGICWSFNILARKNAVKQTPDKMRGSAESQMAGARRVASLHVMQLESRITIHASSSLGSRLCQRLSVRFAKEA